MKLITTLVLSTLSLSACTWVNENPAGESVAITSIDQTPNCQQVGTISARTKYKVGFIKRGKKKILEELQTLARNEALKLGANTITPTGEPVEGKQGYQAFNCPR